MNVNEEITADVTLSNTESEPTAKKNGFYYAKKVSKIVFTVLMFCVFLVIATLIAMSNAPLPLKIILIVMFSPLPEFIISRFR